MTVPKRGGRPSPSSEAVSRNMRRVRTRATGPEMAVRKCLHSSGARYRAQYRPKNVQIGRSSVDIAFPGVRLAVFIDGCFWHGCPVHGTVPKANRDWWSAKLDTNKAQDARVTESLRKQGWTVLRFWSHEEPDTVAAIILEKLSHLRGEKNCD